MKTRWHPESWNFKFFLGVALLLGAINLLGPNGMVHWVLLRQETQRLHTENRILQQEVQKLESDILRFRKSTIVQERMVREELGYLKSDEISIEMSP